MLANVSEQRIAGESTSFSHALSVGGNRASHASRTSSSREIVRELLHEALAVILESPETAHTSISKAAWLLRGEDERPGEPCLLLPIPGALNAWQERRSKEMLEEGLVGGCTIEDVARACDLPMPQFRRAFERTTGLSPLRWQRAMRVKRAKELLYNSDLSLTQITYECGFADQPHFTRAFAAATGSSPGAWRRARRAA